MKSIDVIKKNPHVIHQGHILYGMSLKAVFITVTILIYALLFLPLQLEACGWAGEDEFDEEIEEIIIGADGKPVPETENSAEDPATMTRLGNMYRIGGSIPKDYSKALKLYRKAAEAGFADAQNNLASMYEHGMGVEKNYKESAKWYLKAAEQEEERAQHSLGMLYRDGRGVLNDLQEAAGWFRKSADQGHKGAMRDMGTMYWEGSGVSRSDVRAYMWWKIAAHYGDKKSAELCDMADKKMSSESIAKANQMVRQKLGQPRQRRVNP